MTLLKNGSSISAARAKAACRPSIRPFVCSTFRDFGSERDFLQEQVFPKLDKFCRERGTRFCPVDLRWNKSQSQMGSEHVLRLCLDSIALCAPYFICILGERYGVHRSAESEPALDSATNEWLDKNFETAAACGYEWVLEEDNKYNSLTELEIIQSSFRKKYDYGYFYFRDPAHLEDRLSLEVPLSEHNKAKVNYESESDYCARKMKELKQQIIDTELPVRHFRTLDELGELVVGDWMSIINNLYPPIDTSVFRHTDSEDFREWGAHEMFAETRRKMFVRNLKIREMGEVLSNHAEVGQGIKKKTSMVLPTVMTSTFITSLPGADKDSLLPLMVLEGDRGCGKTSLVANWLKQFSSGHPEVPVIPHYVGSSAYSYDVTNFMRRCTKELRLHYLNTDYDDLMENKDIMDFRRVTEAFHAALSLGPCVILIDGADDFGSSADVPAFTAKEMQWLPAQIPTSCRTIITTSKADITFRALSMREDAYVVKVPPLFESKAKRTLLREYVGINSKFLNEEHAAKITSAKLSDLPVFYVAISNELRLFHGHKNAERLLDTYIQATNLGELWSLILRRWARDYGWLMPAATRGPASMKAQVSRDRSNSGWVADTLRLVAISRNGLTVEEVLGSLKVMGYARNHEVTTAHWMLFNLASQNVLVGTSQGLLTFFHQSFRGAVESALLRSLTSHSQERVISPFKEVWERQKQQCHNVLSNYFSTVEPATARAVEELPWQHRMSRNVNGLSKSLSNPGIFVRLTSSKRELNRKLDMISYWKALEDEGQNPVELLQQMVKDSLGKVESVSSSRRDVSSSVSTTEELSSIEVLCNKTEEDHFTEMEVSMISFFAGKLLAEQNQHVAAEELLLSAYKYGYTVASVRDLAIICRVQESLGNLYLGLCMKERAEYWFRGALKTAAEQTRVTDKVHHEAMVGRILNQLGIILLGNISSAPPPSEEKVRSRASTRVGRPKTPSMQRSSSAASRKKSGTERANFKGIGPLLNESLKHMELARVVPGKTAVYFQMGLCAFGQKQYGDAELLFRNALSMREQWYGSSHPLVAEIIETMATLYSLDGLENSDPILAEKMYRKALRMREQSFGACALAVADTLVNLGKLLQQKCSKDATREAKQLLQRALDIRTTKLGVYHVTSKLVRRDLMALETVDAFVKLSSKGSGRQLRSLESSGTRSLVSATSRLNLVAKSS